MRLIDADALLKSAGIFEIKMAARGCGKSILHLAKAWLFNEVNKAPTIDAVSVVRCKECKHYENHRLKVFENCVRNERYIPMKQDDFCSYGERRSDV